MIKSIVWFVVFVTYVTSVLMSLGIRKLSGEGDKITCYCPFLNVAYAEQAYFRKYRGINKSVIFFMISGLVRYGIWYYGVDGVIINTLSSALFIIACLLLWFNISTLVYNIMADSWTMFGWRRIIYSIIFPLGQLHVGITIPLIIDAIDEWEVSHKR